MNIDWNTAPEWANYAAMDEDGQWWWYEKKPETVCDGSLNRWNAYGCSKPIPVKFSDWQHSLQERPQ